HYLGSYVQQLGLDWEQFLELGRDAKDDTRETFSMTVFALKLSSKANGVAKLHGQVCREMWKSVWKNMDTQDIPIFSITNGVHLETWTSRSMRRLLDKYCKIEWGKNEDDPTAWAAVQDIPDQELWDCRMMQKKRLIENIKKKIYTAYAKRGEDPQFIRDTLHALRPDVLVIGFARRFASYKRSTLIFKDKERLARILDNEDRPVILLFAGKAHPADSVGKSLIKEIVEISHSDEFRGKVIFVENYNMGIGRLLTRGVDVWLNTPHRPHEASGTSGMK
ncbi:unnamed protein product, partial [marine sediment metagenome]